LADRGLACAQELQRSIEGDRPPMPEVPNGFTLENVRGQLGVTLLKKTAQQTVIVRFAVGQGKNPIEGDVPSSEQLRDGGAPQEIVVSARRNFGGGGGGGGGSGGGGVLRGGAERGGERRGGAARRLPAHDDSHLAPRQGHHRLRRRGRGERRGHHQHVRAGASAHRSALDTHARARAG
jgi:hypothetical protein